MTVSPDAFKAYDIRGLYPQELDAEGARRIGAALAAQLGARRLAVGHDPRLSSPELAAAFAVGAESAGAQVTGFGMIPTEMLYFGVADRGFDGGAAVTASHNPPQYNGMKLVGEGALPLSGDAGIPELKRRVLDMDAAPAAAEPHLIADDLYPDYVEHLLAQVDAGALRPCHVVMDAANGAAGKLAPLVFDRTPIERVELYFEVDGRFPNHEPNPLLEDEQPRAARTRRGREGRPRYRLGRRRRPLLLHRRDRRLRARRLRHRAAGRGAARPASRRQILYDLRASRAVPDTIRAAGGEALVNRVGHAFFKQRMRRESVLFGGEVSGHYYFQANHNADSGFIPALLILELLSRKRATMAELLAPLRSTYFISGEINSRVDDVPAALARLERRFADGEIAHLDGVSVDYPDWHFNVRPSNTEPLLRLNLGATSAAQMEEKRDLVLSVILAGVAARERRRRRRGGTRGWRRGDLGPERVAELDTGGQFGAVARLSEQLEAGYTRAVAALTGKRLVAAGQAERRRRLRHGRLGDRRRRRGRLSRRSARALPGRARLRAAGLGVRAHAGRRGELLGQHRRDARLRRARPGARLPAGLRGVGRTPRRAGRAARPAAGRRAGRPAAARLDRLSVDADRRRPRSRRSGARVRRAGRRGHRGHSRARRRARPRGRRRRQRGQEASPAGCSTACRSSTAPASRRRPRGAGKAS